MTVNPRTIEGPQCRLSRNPRDFSPCQRAQAVTSTDSGGIRPRFSREQAMARDHGEIRRYATADRRSVVRSRTGADEAPASCSPRLFLLCLPSTVPLPLCRDESVVLSDQPTPRRYTPYTLVRWDGSANEFLSLLKFPHFQSLGVRYLRENRQTRHFWRGLNPRYFQR